MAKISVETEICDIAFHFCKTKSENTEIDFGFLFREKKFWLKGRFRKEILVFLAFLFWVVARVAGEAEVAGVARVAGVAEVAGK